MQNTSILTSGLLEHTVFSFVCTWLICWSSKGLVYFCGGSSGDLLKWCLFSGWVPLWDDLMQTAIISLSACQFVEGRDREPETEGHWCCDGCQTQAGGETEGRGQRKEGEGNAVETRVSVLMYTLMWRGNVPWEIMRSKYDSDKWSLIGPVA